MIRLGIVAALLALVAGCGDGGGQAVDRSRHQLTQQRLDVREGGRALLRALEGRLSGTTHTASGQYRGCESAFNDQYASFQYLAQGRVDTPGPASPGDLEQVLRDAGFSGAQPSTGPGGQRMVRATSADVTAVLTVVDGQSAVLLDVSGPCVEVPEDQRDDWLEADEPWPDLR